MSEPSDSSQISGWLWKWTNIIGGYQKRWFVISNGTLCYYKNRAEMAHTCRGTINLAGATIDYDDSCKFVISRNGYAYHVKADNEEEKRRWIGALTLARDVATVNEENSRISNVVNAESIIKHFDTKEAVILMSSMKKKLKDVQACNDLINQHGITLQRSINELEGSLKEDDKLREVTDRTAVFQSTASSMINACTDYLEMAESHSRQWIKMFQSEQEQRVRLEKIVKSLTQVRSLSTTSSTSEDESSYEYYDCSETDLISGGMDFNASPVAMKVFQVVDGSGSSKSRTRRSRVPDRPNVSANLWSIIKNCIGKDLTKMPLPVAFAEPLSLLQRLTEDFEYTHVLDKASECTDVAKQFTYIAGFVISSYSTTIARNGKPFNPLLGETYECDRMSESGFRSIAEQVSHHPPVAALHCEGKQWEVWMEESMLTKFRGTTLSIIPTGECHLKFKDGNRYSWTKPTTNVHNIIIGKLWVEQEGDVVIKSFPSGFTCKLTFLAGGWFGELYSVKGSVLDKSGKSLYDLSGRYSTQIEAKPAGSKEPGTVVWKRNEPPADSAKYYSFTLFACQLNEMEDGVAPTDSRFRPDQRLMEEGNFDEANVMKKKLEDHQRANKSDNYKPTWFKQEQDPDTKTKMWRYQGEYWPCKNKKDWSRCPTHIYNPG